ncbi:uncharacterized protein [Argopecten irradians]|uniref:uncharacterized protein n=1 Tax=Argopecten irradians TaxID=31199 RepID=UPI0037183952
MDGVSLHTNIPHADGIAVCHAAWDRRVSNHPSTQSLVDLLKLVLILNNFNFNDENYLQISGTAMGTKMAPSYANVFMRHLESAILTSAQIKPFSWLRFIYDMKSNGAPTDSLPMNLLYMPTHSTIPSNALPT